MSFTGMNLTNTKSRTSALLSIVLFMNFYVVYNWLNIKFELLSTSYLEILLPVFYLFLYNYGSKSKRRIYLIFIKNNSSRKNQMLFLFVLLYTIASFILFAKNI